MRLSTPCKHNAKLPAMLIQLRHYDETHEEMARLVDGAFIRWVTISAPEKHRRVRAIPSKLYLPFFLHLYRA